MALYSRLLWLFILVCHALAAGAWLLMMPGGFAWTDARFWANRLLPAAVLLAIVVAIALTRRGRTQFTHDVLTALAATHLAAAVCCVLLFPISRWAPAVSLVVAGAVVALARTQVPTQRRPRWALIPAAVGFTIGNVMVATQRAPLPTARPMPASATEHVSGPASAPVSTQPAQGVLRLTPSLIVHPGDGSVDITTSRAILSVHPLLTFTSRSPDRFWTCFAPRHARLGPPRRLTARGDPAGGAVELHYVDDGTSSLRVATADDAEAEAVRITAESMLPADVFSHLNTFTEIHVAGHRRLSIAFSPCGDERFAFTSQDTAPARFAYVDAARRFHVAQARAGEKGPFRSLASGTLAIDEPLTITLFDEGSDAPLAQVTLHEWAAQASTAASPTAGWGVPQNAIEFSLAGDADRSTASLYITLAATSVGRGFDSVGHAAGTYVNRVTIELPAHDATAVP
jgi:hypothetical protein